MVKQKKIKRKIYKKRSKKMTMTKSPITFIKRKCQRYDALLVGSGAITLSFALSDLPNYGDFTNLFDFYRICAVKIHVIFQANSNDTGALGSLSIPLIHYIADYDDTSGAFTSESMALEKENIKTKRLDKPFTYYIVPRVSNQVFQSLASTGYAIAKKNIWLDSKDYNIPHFGFKSWIVTGNNTGQLKMYATYYMQFKGAQ